MKRCYNIGVVKAELERVWTHKAISFLSISNICHLFIMATGVVECKPNFQLCILIFPRKIRPWEIFVLPCLPACSNTGVIRIHLKPHLNGIWQHSESFIKNSDFVKSWVAQKHPLGHTINRKEMKWYTVGIQHWP